MFCQLNYAHRMAAGEGSASQTFASHSQCKTLERFGIVIRSSPRHYIVLTCDFLNRSPFCQSGKNRVDGSSGILLRCQIKSNFFEGCDYFVSRECDLGIPHYFSAQFGDSLTSKIKFFAAHRSKRSDRAPQSHKFSFKGHLLKADLIESLRYFLEGFSGFLQSSPVGFQLALRHGVSIW